MAKACSEKALPLSCKCSARKQCVFGCLGMKLVLSKSIIVMNASLEKANDVGACV